MPSLRYTYRERSYFQAEMIRMDGLVKAENSNNLSLTGHDWLFPRRFNSSDPNAIEGVETDDTYVRFSNVHAMAKGWTLKTQVAFVKGKFWGDGMYVSTSTKNYDTLYREYWNNHTKNELTTAQSFVSGKFRTGEHVEHSILGGIDYGKTLTGSSWGMFNPEGEGTQLPISVRNPQYNLTHAELSDVPMSPRDEWGTEWTAGYLQDHMKLFNKVVVTLAGRFSYTRSWASYDENTVYDTKFTPRFGLTYLINDHMSLYALYDQTFLPQTGRLANATSAKPLTGINKEVGFKSQLFDKRLAFNASLFHIEKNNVLVQNPQTSLFEQRGQITSKGFEADASGNVTRNVVVNANYTLTDAKITEDSDPTVIGFGNYGVARHTGNAMVRYKFLSGKLDGFSVGAGAQFIGERTVVWPGRNTLADKYKTAPSYSIYDVNIGYDSKKISIYLNVYNIFDLRYMETAWWYSEYIDEENPENNFPGYFSFIPSPPVNFRLSASYRL
jgi:iron complex outermembrane receptor protein